MITISRPKSHTELENLIDNISESEGGEITATTIEAPRPIPGGKTSYNSQRSTQSLQEITEELRNKAITEIRKERAQNILRDSKIQNQNATGTTGRLGHRNRGSRTQNNINRPSRTTDMRPICYSCGKSGHIAVSCYRNHTGSGKSN